MFNTIALRRAKTLKEQKKQVYRQPKKSTVKILNIWADKPEQTL